MNSLTLFENSRRRVLIAWSGLILMIASVIWLESLPPREGRGDVSGEQNRLSPVFRVVIDPGHGGKDSGALHSGIIEKELTLDIAQRLAPLLQAEGFATTLTRATDEYVSLGDRAMMANAQRDCVFVSIHFDEGQRAGASGVTTFYAARQSSTGVQLASWIPFLQRAASVSPNMQSQSLAAFIQQSLVSHTQAVDRGTRTEQFFVIANVRHPAVLIEAGFLTNKDDVSKLTAADYRQQLAAAIGEGIVHYRNALPKSEPTILAAVPRTE